MDDKLREVVRIYDSAIDVLNSETLEYARTRDVSLLKFLPGKEPTRFKYRRLSRDQVLKYVDTAATENEKFVRAFACGVSRVDNYREGQSWEPAQVPGKSWTLCSDRDLDAFGLSDLIEIGAVIYQESTGPLDSAPTYQLPQVSVRVWVGRTHGHPSAEPSPKSADPSSENQGGA